MILRDNGPDSSVEEDMKVLGLDKVFNLTEAKDKKAAEKPGVDPETRNEVDVRQEAKKEPEPKGDDSDESKDSDEDDSDVAEAISDFIAEALVCFAEQEGWTDEQFEAALEDDKGIAEFVESLEIPETVPARDIKAEAALDILDTFYAQLEAVQESEDEDDKPSYDELVGVIEAYEYLTGGPDEMDEALATMGAKSGRKIYRGGKLKTVTAAMLRAGKKKAAVLKRTGGELQSTMKLVQKGGRFVKQRKTGKERRAERRLAMRGKAKRARHAKMTKSRNEETESESQNTPLSELIRNLADLRNAVQEGRQDSDDAQSAAEELLTGFQAIHETATTWSENIAKEVKEAKADEDDPRVKIGRYLESIAEDALKIGTMIAEGEEKYGLDDYAEDLERLAADLDDAVEAMKNTD